MGKVPAPPARTLLIHYSEKRWWSVEVIDDEEVEAFNRARSQVLELGVKYSDPLKPIKPGTFCVRFLGIGAATSRIPQLGPDKKSKLLIESKPSTQEEEDALLSDSSQGVTSVIDYSRRPEEAGDKEFKGPYDNKTGLVENGNEMTGTIEKVSLLCNQYAYFTAKDVKDGQGKKWHWFSPESDLLNNKVTANQSKVEGLRRWDAGGKEVTQSYRRLREKSVPEKKKKAGDASPLVPVRGGKRKLDAESKDGGGEIKKRGRGRPPKAKAGTGAAKAEVAEKAAEKIEEEKEEEEEEKDIEEERGDEDADMEDEDADMEDASEESGGEGESNDDDFDPNSIDKPKEKKEERGKERIEEGDVSEPPKDKKGGQVKRITKEPGKAKGKVETKREAKKSKLSLPREEKGKGKEQSEKKPLDRKRKSIPVEGMVPEEAVKKLVIAMKKAIEERTKLESEEATLDAKISAIEKRLKEEKSKLLQKREQRGEEDHIIVETLIQVKQTISQLPGGLVADTSYNFLSTLIDLKFAKIAGGKSKAMFDSLCKDDEEAQEAYVIMKNELSAGIKQHGERYGKEYHEKKEKRKKEASQSQALAEEKVAKEEEAAKEEAAKEKPPPSEEQPKEANGASSSKAEPPAEGKGLGVNEATHAPPPPLTGEKVEAEKNGMSQGGGAASQPLVVEKKEKVKDLAYYRARFRKFLNTILWLDPWRAEGPEKLEALLFRHLQTEIVKDDDIEIERYNRFADEVKPLVLANAKMDPEQHYKAAVDALASSSQQQKEENTT